MPERAYSPLTCSEVSCGDSENAVWRRDDMPSSQERQSLTLGVKLSYALPRLACSLFSQHIAGKARKYYTGARLLPSDKLLLLPPFSLMLSSCSGSRRLLLGERRDSPSMCISQMANRAFRPLR